MGTPVVRLRHLFGWLQRAGLCFTEERLTCGIDLDLRAHTDAKSSVAGADQADSDRYTLGHFNKIT